MKFVAAKKSDPRVSDKVWNEMDVVSDSTVREMATSIMLKHKEHHAGHKKLDNRKEHRKMKKLISSKSCMTNSKDLARHEAEKLPAKEVTKSKEKINVSKPHVAQKRKTIFPGFKQMHHRKRTDPVCLLKKKIIKSILADTSRI